MVGGADLEEEEVEMVDGVGQLHPLPLLQLDAVVVTGGVAQMPLQFLAEADVDGVEVGVILQVEIETMKEVIGVCHPQEGSGIRLRIEGVGIGEEEAGGDHLLGRGREHHPEGRDTIENSRGWYYCHFLTTSCRCQTIELLCSFHSISKYKIGMLKWQLSCSSDTLTVKHRIVSSALPLVAQNVLNLRALAKHWHMQAKSCKSEAYL